MEEDPRENIAKKREHDPKDTRPKPDTEPHTIRIAFNSLAVETKLIFSHTPPIMPPIFIQMESYSDSVSRVDSISKRGILNGHNDGTEDYFPPTTIANMKIIPGHVTEDEKDEEEEMSACAGGCCPDGEGYSQRSEG